MWAWEQLSECTSCKQQNNSEDKPAALAHEGSFLPRGVSGRPPRLMVLPPAVLPSPGDPFSLQASAVFFPSHHAPWSVESVPPPWRIVLSYPAMWAFNASEHHTPKLQMYMHVATGSWKDHNFITAGPLLSSPLIPEQILWFLSFHFCFFPGLLTPNCSIVVVVPRVSVMFLAMFAANSQASCLFNQL